MKKKTVASETEVMQRTPVQDAAIELRKSQGMSQQAFATYLHRSINSIAVWETGRPPTGMSLVLLRKAAMDLRRKDLAAIFDQALNSSVPFLKDNHNAKGLARR